MTALSAQWKSLTAAQKRPYLEREQADRERYNRECAEADAAAYKAQQERLAMNSMPDEGEDIRASSRGARGRVDAERAEREAYERQRKKELRDALTPEEREERRAAKAAKKAEVMERQRKRDEEEAAVEARHNKLDKEATKKTEERLKYLLGQSEIFARLKAGKKRLEGDAEEEKKEGEYKSKHSPSRKKKRGRKAAVADDPEGEGVDEDDEEEGSEEEHIFLTKQPDCIKFGQLKPYQLEGLNWMIHLAEKGLNGILADEMGLGKTLQSISILAYHWEFLKSQGPHLVCVPKSTLSNWMNELNRWCPSLRAIRFHGAKEEREALAEEYFTNEAAAHDGKRPTKQILNEKTGEMEDDNSDNPRAWDVCVTTYEVANTEKKVLSRFAWKYLVIDEAHRLKNESSMFSATVRSFNTAYRLLLTGTPLQNNLHELWALLNYLVPDVFASAEQFDEWFNLDIDDAQEKNKIISQLHKILRPFMLRRLKVDVEKSLPPKSETILFTGMSSMQKKLYRDILMRDLDTLTGKGGNGNRTAVLNIVMQLRKCAGHPYLFPGIEDRTLDPLGEHLVENCGKMVLLDKLLLRLKERGHRVLLFTQMTRILDILEDYMHMRGFQYCRIDGNTTYEDREERIDSYNKPDSEKFLFLLSTRAGGLGINLQTADVVILFDSDWNPQADLQAQDRAHRIGQKRQVQVFRLVTEDTIEQKIVERAQQKLKLDAMVVQQGRLKDQDNKLSRDELLEAIRFGADKIFKSKDSSITDDDIDLILDAGKKKTQELNDKLQEAQKGDMLDFKLDGGISAQMFEGVDYSDAKTAQFQEDILGMIDMGKRERRTVAYNENQLYMQQMAQQGATQPKKKKQKKEIKLPRTMRLPRLEEWQMFDRTALNAIQEVEEQAFRALPNDVQLLACGMKVEKSAEEAKPSDKEQKSEDGPKDGEDTKAEDGKAASEEKKDDNKEDEIDLEETLSKLITDEQKAEKARLLAEGFSDWSRLHYSAFLKASAKYGRTNYVKIANEVGKPVSAIQTYSEAFFDEEFGKKRFSEHEYDRIVKIIEKGEKRIDDTKGLQRGTRVLISLFENPWVELQFTHYNMKDINKDKKFTPQEDRFLLCWAHKYGYGQWEAIKFAIRRSNHFRFDYFFKSLTVDAIGRRCEQLMRAAEKEVEAMEKLAIEEAEKEGRTLTPGEIKLPMFKESQAKKRAEQQTKFLEERATLEQNVVDIDEQIMQIQKALRDLEGNQTIDTFFKAKASTEIPEKLVGELANIIARMRSQSMVAITDEFLSKFPGKGSKKSIGQKIEAIGVKEKRAEEGDTAPYWYLRQEKDHLLTKTTKAHVKDSREARLAAAAEKSKKRKADEDAGGGNANGAIGPEGDFVEFPEYDGEEEPHENKKAFTLFCKATRREVKNSLSPSSRKNKDRVNGMLKDRWYALTDDEKQVWKGWEVWDAKRYEYQSGIYEGRKEKKSKSSNSPSKADGPSIPKKSIPKKARKDSLGDGLSIPKKRKS